MDIIIIIVNKLCMFGALELDISFNYFQIAGILFFSFNHVQYIMQAA